MLSHTNYDNGNEQIFPNIKLPEIITQLSVSHDGGRLTICINGQEVYYNCTDTRDCCIKIDNT